uniref:Uncharacterized protein n=1 Tax=Arundo donax TaxID=35708 RepID=A0A0A9C965_ARUDO
MPASYCRSPSRAR